MIVTSTSRWGLTYLLTDSGPQRDLRALAGRCSCTGWTWRCDSALRRERINERPDPGVASESIRDPIEQLIAADHPEHHLTLGHEDDIRFVYGSTPTVLHYLAIPQGSLVWCEVIARRDRLGQEQAELEQKPHPHLPPSLAAAAAREDALDPETALQQLSQAPRRVEVERLPRD
jgi:hypothetical protein